MSAVERWSLHVAALATALTGLADGYLRWFGAHAGEFGPEPHPWLPVAQHAHVLVAPLLLFCLGVMVGGHVKGQLRGKGSGRGTGMATLALVGPLALSGYGLQVAASPALRVALAWVHGLTAAAFLASYLFHLAVAAWRRSAVRPRTPGLLRAERC